MKRPKNPHLNIRYLRANRLDLKMCVKGYTRGIYFLFNEAGDILYIGKGYYAQGRICWHKSMARIDFASACIVEFETKGERNTAEIEAIYKFRPPFNVQYNPSVKKAASVRQPKSTALEESPHELE